MIIQAFLFQEQSTDLLLKYDLYFTGVPAPVSCCLHGLLDFTGEIQDIYSSDSFHDFLCQLEPAFSDSFFQHNYCKLLFDGVL